MEIANDKPRDRQLTQESGGIQVFTTFQIDGDKDNFPVLALHNVGKETIASLVKVVNLVGRLTFPAAEKLPTTSATTPCFIGFHGSDLPAAPGHLMGRCSQLGSSNMCLNQHGQLEVLLQQPFSGISVPLRDIAVHNFNALSTCAWPFGWWIKASNGMGPEGAMLRFGGPDHDSTPLDVLRHMLLDLRALTIINSPHCISSHQHSHIVPLGGL